MASSALTLPDTSMSEGFRGKIGKRRKVVLGAFCLQSMDLKVILKSQAFRGSGEGQARKLCSSPEQLFSQPLSVLEKLAKGLNADLRVSVGKVAWPLWRLYISVEKWEMSV